MAATKKSSSKIDQMRAQREAQAEAREQKKKKTKQPKKPASEKKR